MPGGSESTRSVHRGRDMLKASVGSSFVRSHRARALLLAALVAAAIVAVARWRRRQRRERGHVARLARRRPPRHDPDHVARHPPHPRLELRRPGLRLRLRRGEGEHLRARGHLRDRERGALALVRARRHLHPGRQRRHPDQPQQRLLLPAHQGQGHDRGPARAGAAARPAARDQGGACAATWPATTAGCATRASTTSTTRAARASRGCARSPRWTPTSASTSSA